MNLEDGSPPPELWHDAARGRIIDWWRAARRWVRVHSFAINAFVFGVFCLLTVGDVFFDGGGKGGREADALAYLLLVGQTLPLVFRRRYPLGSMYVVCVSISLYWILDYPLGFDGAAVIAIYSGAAYGLPRRRAWLHVTVVVAMVAALSWIPFTTDQDNPAIVAFGFAAVHIAAALLGEVVYQRRQRIADLEQRAIQAEENLELRAQMAVSDERQRIAREMHDVVAHGMSIIAVQAAAAQEIARTNPDKTVEVLANIEGVGRDSLTELRRMLGVLRNTQQSESALTPQPSLDDLAEAVAQSIAAGLPTELVVSGQPRAVPAGVELAAYRIVQEALTNARKHAGGSASATVDLFYQDDSITIEVTDDGAGAMSSLAVTGAGNGLIGMRERVEIYGGELTAGPRDGGGYTVRAVLPVGDAAGRPTVASAASPTHEESS